MNGENHGFLVGSGSEPAEEIHFQVNELVFWPQL